VDAGRSGHVSQACRSRAPIRHSRVMIGSCGERC
jgi:hypothetical protein